MADLARALQSQNIWFNRNAYLNAEVRLAQFKLGITPSAAVPAAGDAPAKNNNNKQNNNNNQNNNKNNNNNNNKKPQNKAAKMVNELKQDLAKASSDSELSNMLDRVLKLEKENQEIRCSLEKALSRLEILEKQGAFQPEAAATAAPVAAPAAAKPAAKPANDDDDDDDDDDDFFASSDEEDEEAKKAAEELKAKRVAEYNARKAAKEEKKGKTIAKSSITFDVKPWDDETDLDQLRDEIKKIEMDGLVWGTAQKKPLAYGIFKLTIVCVVEDDKVSSDDLVEKIEAFEDHVQSVDIAAFQKI